MIEPKAEIVLMGDEDGTRAIASELGLIHIPKIQRNRCGTPLISSAFAAVQGCANNEILCYVNSDIILLPSFSKMMFSNKFSRYLIIGRRTNLWINEPIDFLADNWDEELSRLAEQDGVLHSHWGIDYFVFPRTLWDQIPPFAVGRLMWDNWLIYDARRRQIPVIDATPIVRVIHQNHPTLSNILLADGSWNWTQPEVQSNLALAGGHDCAYNVHDSTWVLHRWGSFPAIGQQYLNQQLSRLTGNNARVVVLRAIIILLLLLHRLARFGNDKLL